MSLPPVTQDVIFKVGNAVAPGALKQLEGYAKQIAVVAGGAAALAFALKKSYDAAAEFDGLVNKASVDMSRFNKETKGLIDTNTSYRQAAVLTNAQIKPTAEQMSAIGKAAIVMNRSLGGNADGATKIFEDLTKAIQMGSKEGLGKFGIRIAETPDKVKAANDALNALVEKFGDVDIKGNRASETLYGFANSVGTVASSLSSSAWRNFDELLTGLTGGTDTLSESLSDLERQLIATRGAMGDWLMSGEWMGEAIASMILSVSKGLRAMGINVLSGFEKELMHLVGGGKGQFQSFEQMQEYMRYDRQRDISRESRARAERAKRAGEFAASGETFVPTARGGGGGGRRSDMEFSLDEIESYDLQDRSPALAQYYRQYTPGDRTPRGYDLGVDMSSAIQSQMGVSSAAEMARIIAEVDKAYADQRLATELSTIETLLGMESGYYKDRIRMRDMDAKSQADALEYMASSTASTFRTIADTVGTQSKRSFEASKAFAFSASQVEGMLASISVFRSALQSLPFPANVIVGAAAATAVTAQAIATGARILQQQYGTATAAAAPTMKGGSFDVGGFGADRNTGNSYSFTVNVGGSTVWQEMVRENEMQAKAGNKSFAVAR